jgi:hypothetical protein
MSEDFDTTRQSISAMSIRDRMNLWKQRDKRNNKQVGDRIDVKATDARSPEEDHFFPSTSESVLVTVASEDEARLEVPLVALAPVVLETIPGKLQPPTSRDIKTYENMWRQVSEVATMARPDMFSMPAFTDVDTEYVRRIWTNISESLPAKPVTETGRKLWREVRLFVSSTFTDYFAEREVLIKKIIPRLRSWCEERRLTLIDIDLRRLI